MIYATCINEQSKYIDYDSFEIGLLQESIDMSLYLANKAIILQESFDDIKAKVKRVVDNIITFMKKLFDTVKEKISSIIQRLKTFLAIGKTKRDIVAKINNVEVCETTDLMDELIVAIYSPRITIGCLSEEKLSAQEIEEKYLKEEFKHHTFKSVSEIKEDQLLKYKYVTIDRADRFFYDLEKNTSELFNLFNNIDSCKSRAVRTVETTYKYIVSSHDPETMNNLLLDLKVRSACYGKLCNLFMIAAVKYMSNSNKIINMINSYLKDDNTKKKKRRK